ncbi:MAG TPA: acetyl-CoA carboxylase biotin carboxylase subunit [Desulfoprunum sp.]|nr:acetyl-CoA carboxylase biotin carboxylase subunit [Desulfoprunum sp.]
MFDKILIANRGEIAVRIIRSCKTMGIGTVAVYSEPDFRSIHVIQADEAVLLGGARPAESYLAMDRIIEAALATGCQAIHPGYGFLSENPAFAEKVAAAGLTFIGPPAAVIAAMGDKIAAKKLALAAGVPTVPGYSEPVASLDQALAAAADVGYPVLLKPAAGGGGKGMRTVERADDLASALRLCQQETRKSFGDDRIFVERFIRRPRHIEIQIIADQHGNVLHLGERECSIQRRYQKIIEESPSCALTPARREAMGTLACRLARQAGYTNAGTVEFILDEDGSFYFLDMNTRLQVEHPVTELVNGLDLVELQLRIAADEPLPVTQEQVVLNGWAMEVRVCAEDPQRGFVPSVGLITRYAAPRGQGVRVDSGVDAGSTISVYYDPLLAKVITWGEDREAARKRMVQALNGYHIEGICTNIDFANQVLTHPVFIRGDLSTDFIPTELLNPENPIQPPIEVLQAMAIATTLTYHLRESLVQNSLLPLKPRVGSTTSTKRSHDYVAKANEHVFPIRLEQAESELQWQVEVDGTAYRITTPPMEFYRRRLKLNIDGEDAYFRLKYRGNFIEAAYCGVSATFEIYNPREWHLARHMPPPRRKSADNILECPMPGLVVAVRVSAGERVFRGQELVILESMKMESAVAAPGDGVVESVLVRPGDAVETGTALVRFENQ